MPDLATLAEERTWMVGERESKEKEEEKSLPLLRPFPWVHPTSRPTIEPLPPLPPSNTVAGRRRRTVQKKEEVESG